MPRQARQASGTGIYHVMMRGINHQNVTLLRYIHQNPVKAGMVSEVKDYEFSSWGEYMDKDASKGRPSDDQVMMLIKEKTGATNSSAFQQLPADIKKSVLIELKGKRASLRQLERLTGISKSMIYRM